MGLQPSTPCDKYARWDYINIFQINTDGIQSKKEELKKRLICSVITITELLTTNELTNELTPLQRIKKKKTSGGE